MNRLINTADRFSFPARGLPSQMLEHIDSKVGHWEYQFARLADRPEAVHWYVGVANGQILYSSDRAWSGQNLLEILGRYVFQTRHAFVKPRFEQLTIEASESLMTPQQLLAKVLEARIADEDQIFKALRTKILTDLDIYLLMGSGEAKFVPTADVGDRLPLPGFDPLSLLAEAKQRRLMWKELKPRVPAMNLVPTLNLEMMVKAKIPAGQQQRIEILVKSGNNLQAIAVEMAKDPLEIADMFAKLVRRGMIEFRLPPAEPEPEPPITIMAIDDSPVMLTQFQQLVSALGYAVVVCQQAENAIETIVKVKPAAIFIDLNMPGVHGFELIKQIRQQPDLAKIPMAILTGEHKFSNRLRAQWSGCDFITKPLTAAAVQDFQAQIEELLPRLLKTVTAATNNSHANN
jgi:CheY-like chemotaxis protein